MTAVPVRYVLACRAFSQRIDHVAQLQQALVDGHSFCEALAYSRDSASTTQQLLGAVNHCSVLPTAIHCALLTVILPLAVLDNMV